MSIRNYKKKAEAKHKKQRAKRLKLWKRDIDIYKARKLLFEKRNKGFQK